MVVRSDYSGWDDPPCCLVHDGRVLRRVVGHVVGCAVGECYTMIQSTARVFRSTVATPLTLWFAVGSVL